MLNRRLNGSRQKTKPVQSLDLKTFTVDTNKKKNNPRKGQKKALSVKN